MYTYKKTEVVEAVDSYTRSLTIADVGLCEQAYAPMIFRSIYI